MITRVEHEPLDGSHGSSTCSISDRFNVFSNTQRRRIGERKTIEATLVDKLSEMGNVLSQSAGSFLR